MSDASGLAVLLEERQRRRGRVHVQCGVGVDDAMDAAKDDDDDGQSGTRPPSTPPSIASHSPFCVVWLTKQMSGWQSLLSDLPIFP